MVLKVSFCKYQSQPIINIALDLNSKSVKGVWDSFSYFIHFKIGDCRKLHFWHGHWFGEFILKERSQIFLLDWYSNGCWMFNLLIIFWVGKIWNVTIFSSLKHLELKSVKCGFGSAFPNPHLYFQTFFFFFFSAWIVTSHKFIVQGTKNTVYALFIHCSRTVHGSHDTIHIFKNYFATIFLVFNFNKNKLYPNGPRLLYSNLPLWSGG